MKHTVREIISVIENFAPLSFQESYDNSGLQVGSLDQEVSSVLLTTDITESVVDEAINKDIHLIISHHPLLFRGLKCISGQSHIERIVIKAIRHDIVLYSAHTNVDKCLGGVSYKMAEMLSLQNVKPLVLDSATNAGLGIVGVLNEPMSEIECLSLVKRQFNVHTIRHSKLLGRPIKKIAMCGGSGAEFISNAIDTNADLYITADIRYHDFFSSENQLVIADIGHFESEHLTKFIFYDLICKNFINFATHVAYTDVNPVCYI